MSILFAGTPENAAETLRGLVLGGAPITLVLTRPDAPVGRKAILTPSPVALAAAELGIPCLKTQTIDSEIIQTIIKKQIEFGVVVALGVLLKAPALAALPKGWFNLHYSILPRWRGAAPVQRAIMSGDTETGVTLFKIDEGLDTGDIVATIPTTIQPIETAGSLLERLTHLGISLLLEFLPKIDSGLFAMAKQSDAGATMARKLTRLDGRIDFLKPVATIDAQIRGVTPEPGAWFESTVGLIKVLQARPAKIGVPLDSIVLKDNKVLVGVRNGSMELIEVQPAGKKSMKASDWYRGIRDGEVQVLSE